MLRCPQVRREYLYRVDTSRYNKYYWVVARGIQAEIKQAKPLSSLEEEALLSLQRTADQLQWRVSELLKPYGISPTQYNALRILRGAREQGRSCSEIAELELLKGLDRPVEQLTRKILGHLGNQRLTTLIKLLEMAREQVA